MTTNTSLPRHREWLVAGAILLAGMLLRLWALDSNPPGLFRDEWEKGYTAFELWTTGRHGVLGAEGVRVSYPAPLFIEVFEGHDRTSAVYQWIAAPIVGLFGLGEFTTRLPAALAGIACLLIGWFAARRHLGVAGGLIVLAALATQPTHILFSRWAQQGILSIAFFLGGLAMMMAAGEAEGRRARLLALGSALLHGLAAWAYDPTRLTLPIVVGAWCVLFGWRQRRDAALTLVVAFAVLWIPLFVYTLTAGSARLSRVALDSSSSPWGIVPNYLSHFDPRYWFVSGDANWRHALPLAGWSGRITGLLAIVGAGRFLFLLAKRTSPGTWLTLGVIVLLAAPLPAALTREGNPHALRSGLMMVGLVMVAGSGGLWLVERLRHRGLALGGLLTLSLLVDGIGAIMGLREQRTKLDAWEAGLLPAMRDGLQSSGRVYLGAEVLYAPYAALFSERTDPRLWQEQGTAALRTRIAAMSSVLPQLRPGDSLVGPPQPPMQLEWLAYPIVQYRNGEVRVWSASEGRMVPLTSGELE
ncbi:hypothetical protein GC173_17295 [bacterium]|nr:hypothetical protein [bacterium]